MGVAIADHHILVGERGTSADGDGFHPDERGGSARKRARGLELAGTALDRVTIYRNLLSLTQAGMLVRTQLGDNVWRFELPLTRASRHGQHPHFVCTDCGHIACLPASNVQLQGGVTRNEVSEVQLRGRCASCVTAGGARDASGRP